MIIFIIISLIIIAQIVVKIVLRDKIKTCNFLFNNEMSKFYNIPNHKRKSVIASIVSICLSLLVLVLPITLNITLYMHFPKEMFIGKLNFLFTFFLGYALFILANIIQYKIIKSYVIEYKQTNPEIDDELLPNIYLKKVFLVELSNVFVSLFVLILVVILFIVR